jgi:glycerophosphoryl diester phosphodiesterase
MAASSAVAAAGDTNDGMPIVIAHRGASAYRPEHTLAAYELAIEMGADYIEQDLVPTADGVLVSRHENEISGSTDVASRPEFAARRAAKTIDGKQLTGWFTEDFTLAELKTLRAVERIPGMRPANAEYDGRFEIPALQEIIDLAKREGVGIYPETKHPTYFASIGLPLEALLVAALRENGLTRSDAPVFLQSFEASSLKQLRTQVEVPLVQLVGSRAVPALDRVAGYADAIGPAKALVVTAEGEPTTFVDDAHRAGLAVHPWTFRPENGHILQAFRRGDPDEPAFARSHGDQPAELALFYRLGVDGVFADNPDTAVAVRADVTR